MLEAAEAKDSSQCGSPQAQVPAKEGGEEGRFTGLSTCQGCLESGTYSTEVSCSSQEPNTSSNQH